MSKPWSAVDVLIPLLAVALMVPGIDEAHGGFLAFSEAWYTLVAHSFDEGSVLRPQVGPGRPDFNVPPLFAWLVHGSFQLLGWSERSARVIALTGAVLAVLAVRQLAGRPAAALLATSPAFVLLSRNVQPDGWATTLSLLAYVAFRRSWLAAALLFGAAMMTKPTVLMFPAALAMAATARARGLRWLQPVHLAWAGLAIVPTACWIALQLSLNRAEFIAGIVHGGGAFEVPTLSFLPVLIAEVGSAFAPGLLIAIGLGFVSRRWRSESAVAPIQSDATWTLAVGLVTFAFVHYHGYYLVALLPAGAVVAGRWLRLRWLVPVVVLNAVFSLVILGGHKLGRSAFADLAAQGRGTTFLLSPAAYDGYWTLIALYGAPEAIAVDGCVTASASSPLLVVPAPPNTTPLAVAYDRPKAPVLLGWGLGELPDNPHRLAWGRLRWIRAPGVLAGFADLGPALPLFGWRAPSGLRVCGQRATSQPN